MFSHFPTELRPTQPFPQPELPQGWHGCGHEDQEGLALGGDS